MTASNLNFEKIMRPLPLSCLLHGVGIVGVCTFLGIQPDMLAPERPMAEVVMEVAPEELPERNVPQAASLNPFAPNSVWENMAGKPTEQSSAQTQAARENPAAAESPANTGSQALLAETEAAVKGDGVTAVGTGSAEAAGGSAAAGGDTGHYEAGEAGIRETAAPPAVSAPAESTASIASRFAARVEANKEYPYMAVKRGLTGAVRVTASLSAEGNLESVYITASSGASLLDEAALQAVRNSCPFSNGAGRSITITVPIHFDLQ